MLPVLYFWRRLSFGEASPNALGHAYISPSTSALSGPRDPTTP